jgi:hypothetical protein
MKRLARWHVERVAALSLSLLVAACYPNPDDLRGNAVGRAITPDANGNIAATSNAYGIHGVFFAESDGWGPTGPASGDCEKAGHAQSACSTVTPSPYGVFPNTNGKTCVLGTSARVVNNATTAKPDYTGIWGAGMGFTFNYDSAANPPNGSFNLTAKNVKGMAFTIDDVPPAGLRVEFWGANSDPAVGSAYWGTATETNTYPPSPVVPGLNVVHLSDVKAPWGVTFDPTIVENMQFHVPTTTSAASDFSFCITNVTVVTE